jgi:cytochrome P450
MIPLNPFDRRARTDPYPIYQYMRTVEPVHHSPIGFWILTRYDDCRAVLEDKRWSHDADRILEPARGEIDPVDTTVRLLRAGIAFADPPHHARHRTPLEAAVRGSARGLGQRVRTTAKGLIKLMHEKGAEADLVRDFATPLPMVVLGDMLGLPAADRGKVHALGRELSSGIDPDLRPAAVLKAGAAAAALVEYMVDRLDAARAGSAKGMLADLQAKPGKLRTWEVIADAVTFLVTGVETSSNLIGNSMLALLRNPEQMDALRKDPSLFDSGLEELIRYDGPVHLTARVATQDMTVGGARIAAGDQAIVLIAAADRDPARFPEPDKLNLARGDNEHLGFGAGTHACFAAPLARQIGKPAISALLDGLDGLELAGEPRWNETITMRGLSRLPVTFRK